MGLNALLVYAPARTSGLLRAGAKEGKKLQWKGSLDNLCCFFGGHGFVMCWTSLWWTRKEQINYKRERIFVIRMHRLIDWRTKSKHSGQP